MCRDCVRSADVERGRSVLDKGAYLMNFKGCAACKRSDGLQEQGRERKETKSGSDEVEEIVYLHVCECGHQVSRHEYSWTCTDEQHIYQMTCDLCGMGEDEQDIYV